MRRKRDVFLFFFVFTSAIFEEKAENSLQKLRILSFNAWVQGENVENGWEKIVHHIKEVDPDIVALQEWRSRDDAEDMLKKLGR